MANDDLESAVIKIYVPTYQKENWREHAGELGMNQSEFVKSMVQAGRHEVVSRNPDKRDSPDETPGVTDVERVVLDAIDEGPCSWDELVEELTKNLGNDLETTLQRLQDEDRVRYSGRHGGYTITGDDDD